LVAWKRAGGGLVREPQEIEEREHEIAVARVPAVDVAKASGVVCTRVPREGAGSRFMTKVWPVDATTNADLGSNRASP
jgi:hypothetical protein